MFISVDFRVVQFNSSRIYETSSQCSPSTRLWSPGGGPVGEFQQPITSILQ